MTQVAAGPVCLNCGAELRGPFCGSCGQKAAATRETIASRFMDNLARVVLALMPASALPGSAERAGRPVSAPRYRAGREAVRQFNRADRGAGVPESWSRHPHVLATRPASLSNP